MLLVPRRRGAQTLLGIYENFDKESFLFHQAELFPEYALHTAYELEGIDYKQTVAITTLAEPSDNGNIWGSHVIFKVQSKDYRTLKLKAMIAPQGTKDRLWASIRLYCSTSPPSVIRVIPP